GRHEVDLDVRIVGAPSGGRLGQQQAGLLLSLRERLFASGDGGGPQLRDGKHPPRVQSGQRGLACRSLVEREGEGGITVGYAVDADHHWLRCGGRTELARLARRADYHDRGATVRGELRAHRAEHEPGEPTEPSRADYDEARVDRGVN